MKLHAFLAASSLVVPITAAAAPPASGPSVLINAEVRATDGSILHDFVLSTTAGGCASTRVEGPRSEMRLDVCSSGDDPLQLELRWSWREGARSAGGRGQQRVEAGRSWVLGGGDGPTVHVKARAWIRAPTR